MARGTVLEVKGMDRLLNKLQEAPEKAERAAQEAVTLATTTGVEKVVDKVTELKLVDTGFYRNGWVASFPTRLEGRISSNVAYALVIEYGFDGNVEVRAHTRKIKSGKKSKVVQVRAHKRHMVRKPAFVLTQASVEIRHDFNRRLLEAIRKVNAA